MSEQQENTIAATSHAVIRSCGCWMLREGSTGGTGNYLAVQPCEAHGALPSVKARINLYHAAAQDAGESLVEAFIRERRLSRGENV